VPAEPLRRFVAWYTGYRQRDLRPARHRGLPSPYLTLIFTLDEPLTMVAHPDPGQPPGEFGTLLGGLHCTPALIAHEGAQSGIQVALRPLGARAPLGLPPKAAARVIRFDRARHLLVRQLTAPGSDTRLADLAVACGYFDQAHLAREFRALAGCPPSQWLAEEFRNVQAGAWLTDRAWEDRTW
jgi:AraC-like DNA-binding protein